MYTSAKSVWLLLIVEMTVVVGVPVLVWPLLPAPLRVWLTTGDGVAPALTIVALVSVAIGLMAMIGFWLWQVIARRMFGRENIDAQVAEWSKRR